MNSNKRYISRIDLKNRFKKGSIPSETDFFDFIESVPNIIDDGFAKTPEHGLKITQNSSDSSVMSFYTNTDIDMAKWQLKMLVCGSDQSLFFSKGSKDRANPHLTLRVNLPSEDDDTSQSKDTLQKQYRFSGNSVGINKSNPEHELDVDGTISSRARIGHSCTNKEVKADGKWHPITSTLSGCHLLEIVAGVGAADDSMGRYAMIRAIAMNTFNRNRNIKIQQAYFGGRGSRIQLKWKTLKENGDFTYCLQMRTRKPYSGVEPIQYFITQLWLNPLMENQQSPNQNVSI